MSVVVTYLEMCDPSWLRAANSGPRSLDLDLRRLGEPCPVLNRFFYVEVGRNFRWVDRLGWTEDQWHAWVCREPLSTWIGWSGGNPVGYAELERQGDDLEIVYFGLLPQFIGRGLGGPLLSAVVEEAWSLGPSRLWLHTCTLDHPAALANYQQRGFRAYKTETIEPAHPLPSG